MQTIHTEDKQRKIRIKATVIEKTTDSYRLQFKLDRNGYVVKFPIVPILTIWIDAIYCKHFVDDLWDIDQEAFDAACVAPMSNLRSLLIIKHGMNPSLVINDMSVVYPEDM